MMRATLISTLLLSLLGCSQSFDNVNNGLLSGVLETPLVISETLNVESTEELYALGQQQYQANCANCHGAEGAGSPGSSILSPILSGNAISHTWQAMPPSNPSACDSDCATAVIAWVADRNGIELSIQVGGSTTPNNGTPEPVITTLEPRTQTLRRASTLFSQTIPTVLENETEISGAELRHAIRSTMTGEGFRQFIKDGANDQLLLRGITKNSKRVIQKGLEGFYPEYKIGTAAGLFNRDSLAREVAESPLELIYYVVDNDKPYSEILTADYVMVSQYMAPLYQTNLAESEGQWAPAQNKGQYVRTSNDYASENNWAESRKTVLPHAGVLTSWAYTSRYPTTATNRNRARAKQTLLHFLGYDIEASTPRLELDDSIDTDNPTLENPVCTSCHDIMDPIAGAFQNFGDKGIFNGGSFGLDSLAIDYKKTDLYQSGDTWYNDMLAPGYYDAIAPQGSNGEGQSNSIVWLAQQIVNDDRFATATVKFWWSAVFGRDIHESDFELIETLANDFRTHLNLKDLLVDMVMSDAYRFGALNDTARPRIVTPELMAKKYSSLSSVEGTFISKHELFFGGHDSWVMTKRERDINAIMVNVLKHNAYKNSCKMAFEDFKLSMSERKIFKSIELDVLAGSLKRFVTTSATSSNESTDTVTTIALNGETQLSLAIRGHDNNDVFLTNIKVKTNTGYVIFDGAPLALTQNGGAVLDNSRSSEQKLGFYDVFNNALVTLPTLSSGAESVTIVLSMRSRTNTTAPNSVVVDVLGKNGSSSFANERIRYQLVDMAQLLWNEQYAADSTEIDHLFKAFQSLQLNAQARGETNTNALGYQCEGVRRVNNHDLDYTFAAWKGVLAAMLSDVSFLLN